MDWGYILKHWISTLVLAPILAQIAEETEIILPDKPIGLFEIYPITLTVSAVFSLPTLLFYLFVYHVAADSNMKTIWVKVILTIWVAIGISLTLYLLDTLLILDLGSYYMIASTICGLLLKMKQMPKEMVDCENRDL